VRPRRTLVHVPPLAHFPRFTLLLRLFEALPPKVFRQSTEVKVSDQSGLTALSERWPTLEGEHEDRFRAIDSEGAADH